MGISMESLGSSQPIMCNLMNELDGNQNRNVDL
jgi:hypothetical protein